MSQLKILIIDDNPSDRNLALRELKKLFSKLQYREIIDEASLNDALKRNQFNLVITDYQIRWITGLEILSRVKEKRPDCPVIMFTGTGSEEIAVSAMKAGLDDYVIKTPRHYVRLAAAVRSAWQKFQQKQALDEFKQSYYRLFERIPLGLYRLNARGEILEANSTLIKMLGCSSGQDVKGQTMSAYHDESDRFLQWQQQLQYQGATAEFESKIRQQDETLIWVRHNATAIKNAKEQVVCYEGAVADITGAKRAELERIELLDSERQARQSAERANRLKDEFLTTLSHELRTPLNAIVGWAQLLRMGNIGEPQFTKALDTIDRNARAQNQLVNDLLDVSTIIRGTVTLKPKPVDLWQIVMASLDTVTPGANAKQLKIITKPARQPVEVNGDEERLQQVFWNLLSNAVKFTSVGGTIAVSSHVTNSEVVIEVRDTGQGINADVLPYVFDRFRQAETKSSTRTQGGLGLGLAIARHLVEMHGGEIIADSEGIGRGAVFTVKLPVLDRRSQADSDADPANLELSLKGLKLLVVEDEDDAREMVTLILEQYGAEVIAAESVKRALAEYDKHQPDILISDISMPVEDGFSLIKQIRNSGSAKSNLPAIALTAYASDTDRKRVLAAGFDLHLPKPIQPNRLIESVSLLTRRQNRFI